MTNIKKQELEYMPDAEIAALLDQQKTSYAREVVVGHLISGRFYDRSVYHAAMGYAKCNGNRTYATVNKHLESGVINSNAVRYSSIGWSQKKPTSTKAKPVKRGGRGSNKGFSIKGAEIKRIVTKDGPVPATFTSGVEV